MKKLSTPAGNVALLPDGNDIGNLLTCLAAIRADLVSDRSSPRRLLARIHPRFQESARNLIHYLALRRHDLRELQLKLASLGLSSLGRAECQVLPSIDAVLNVLQRLSGRNPPEYSSVAGGVDFAKGQALLAGHTQDLLGPVPAERNVRIMVTMSGEAAYDYALVLALLRNGMDCARINCAHDGPEIWQRIIEHVRRAEAALGQTCRIVMDLGGPKLRTGPLEPGPAVLRIRPRRDVYGQVKVPARVWLHPDHLEQRPPATADACLPVAATWLERIRCGDTIEFRDARDARRTMRVVDTTPRGCWAELSKTAYITPKTRLRHRAKNGKHASRDAAPIGLEPLESVLSLCEGESLIITRNQAPGRPAKLDSAGRLLMPATIGCTIPNVFDEVRTGESIWFDDGKIGAVVERVDADEVLVRITHTRIGGGKLRADKGINLPESNLRLGALTEKDIEDLSFVMASADVVELSFANCAADVDALQERLLQLGPRRPGIVLKVETRRGFENLPEMLLHAMRWPCCGVMIARGDLAVECGFERLAEVQEEILWICEAAHVPVIWATQVLENLANQGMPSRSEITDAAMGHRAECVMLNKGPHIVSAVRALDDILRRMQTHQSKKRAMLRELHLAHTLCLDGRGE